MEFDYVIVALVYNPTGDSVDVIVAKALTDNDTFVFNATRLAAKGRYVGQKLKIKITEVPT